MYSKYTLFYESPKNWEYLRACTNSVYHGSPRGEGPGNEARCKHDAMYMCSIIQYTIKNEPEIIYGLQNI